MAGAALAGLLSVVTTWFGSREIDVIASGSVGVGVFLAWAIAREIDPDRPGTATLAMVAAGGLAFIAPAAAGIAAVVLIGLRAMVGTVGTPLRIADLVVIVAAAGYAGTRPEGWAAVGVLAAGLAMARPERLGVALGALFAAGVIGAVVAGAVPQFDLSVGTPLALLACAGLATALAVPVLEVASTTDVGGRPLSPVRVTRARLVAGLSIAVAAVVSGSGAASLSPVLGALVAVAVSAVRSPTRPVDLDPVERRTAPVRQPMPPMS
jgi:hypothetical protein